MNMNKEILISAVADKTGYTKQVSREVVSTVVDIIMATLENKNKVSIQGFGTFSVEERKERIGTDINNGNQKIVIPATKYVKFTCGKHLKEAMKNI